MNVFDVLYSGKRRITEENVSSFLAWMLDPTQSHGWGALFLERFLAAVDADAFSSFFSSYSPQVAYREQSRVGATVVMEESVTTSAANRRDVDIVVYLSGDHSSPKAVLIENKISGTAVSENQLRDELDGFLNGEFQFGAEQVAIVYLTADAGRAAVREFESISGHPGPKSHLSWSGSDGSSVESFIRAVLADETEGRIDPFSTESRWLLKSFLRAIHSGFEVRTRQAAVATTPQTEYFVGQARGIEELRLLANENGDLYVGFDGGEAALAAATKDYLQERTFRYDTDPARGNKNPKNWFKIGTVLAAYDSKA